MSKPNSRLTQLGDCLISQGEHCGFTWCTSHNGIGFRNGYVRVPRDHPWFAKEYGDIDADIHGGLTYSEPFEDGHWIGFDCAHLGDKPDPSLPGHKVYPGYERDGLVRDLAYVENECQKLCEQAFRYAVESGESPAVTMSKPAAGAA